MNGDIGLQQRTTYSAILVLIISVGIALRLYIPVVEAPLIVHDGAFHLVLAQDLIQNHFVLPKFTTYNYAGIPFAYPPLSTYLLALLSSLLGIEIIDSLRYFPALISCAVLVASMRLFGYLCSSRLVVCSAVLFASLLPHSFIQQVKGGGISRSLGALFAILAITAICRLSVRHGTNGEKLPCARSSLFWPGLFLGLTFLSHPEWSVVAIAFLVCCTVGGGGRLTLRQASRIVLIALLVCSPWLTSVLAFHGVEPFLALLESGGGGQASKLWTFNIFGELGVSWYGFLAYWGFFILLSRRAIVIPSMVLVLCLLLTRGYVFAIWLPFAILAGEGGQALVTLLRTSDRWLRVGFCLCFAILLAQSISLLSSDMAAVRSISKDDADAFNWMRDHTPKTATSLVISGSPWWSDYLNEILPALGERRGLITCQGLELASRGRFAKCLEEHRAVAEWSSSRGVAPLEQRLDSLRPDLIFLSKSSVLLETLLLDQGKKFEQVYHNNTVAVVRYASDSSNAQVGYLAAGVE